MHGTTKYITLEDAKKAMAAAEAEARKNSWNVAIAIVDAGGNLVLFEKIDDTQLGSVNIGPFRRLERMVRGLAQQHQTCLYFVRTVYGDTSQMPSQIEQCVIQPSKAVSYAIHANL